MKPSRRTVVALAVVAAVAGGSGAAIAASGNDRPAPKAFLDAVAKHLGVSPAKLQDAIKAAAIDRVDAAQKAGRLTKRQADQIRSRIRSGKAPFLGGGPGFGFGGGPGFEFRGRHELFFGGPGGNLGAAAKYLGLSDAALRKQLESGKSLAAVAKAQGKSVTGLEDALIADAKSHLDKAVADKRLTQAQADDILSHLKSHVGDMVNGTPGKFRGMRRFRGGFGPPPGFDGPPPGGPPGFDAPSGPGAPPAPVPL